MVPFTSPLGALDTLDTVKEDEVSHLLVFQKGKQGSPEAVKPSKFG